MGIAADGRRNDAGRIAVTRIKICGITRAEDAMAVAASGADAIGLVFYAKSPRHASAEQAAQLAAVLPPFVTTVGLFVDADAAFVREVLRVVPLDVLQFHGDETPEYCAQFGRPYLKAIRVKAGVDLLQCAAQFSTAQALLLDAYVAGVPGGTGATFDWGLIPRQLPLPVILSGGLDAENVAEAIERVRPYAVDVSSGVEVGKGIKDAAKVAAFVNEVKRVDVQLSR
ncbi:MAG: N-(5'-phosphoribosyl)anthranilate isomerase [Gallionellales bacterium GWA2_60_142]|jgi:phosphoribosylanthranilate isomerase|nr:MAG: N-(5'-phosphoribosyl)anthranilate isomerase [Gallionellales bacterium GWA2_60_142]